MAEQALIIGGTRFLGKAISGAFIGAGYQVYEMNRGTRPISEGAAGRITCDKTDRKAFAAALTSRKWDVIVDTILNDDDLKFVVETLGCDVGHFIHTGSFGVYGEARRVPAAEDQELREVEGECVVFNQKLRQDRVVMNAFRERNFPGTCLRMSYIYGAGDIPLDGWGGRSPLFFKMLRAGETLPIPNDGRALLHPGHVKDLGRAFLHAARRPASKGQVYNIGGDYALMMRDYIALLASAMGVEARLEYMPPDRICAMFPAETSRKGMLFSTQHMCASIEKARRELDWRPEIQLETGLKENAEWMAAKGIL